MTLSRKILVRNLLLLLGVLVLGGVSLAGLWRLHRQVDVALDEYAELRILQRVSVGAASARGALAAEPPDLAAARQELLTAAAGISEYQKLQSDAQEGSASHEDVEHRSAQRALEEIRDVLATLEASPPSAADRARMSRLLGQVLKEMRRLTQDADELVAKTERRATSGLLYTALGVGGIFLLIVAAAAVIGLQQHRSIVRPLGALRDGVRRIALRRFSQRLPVDGDREFAEVAADFNRMAAELDGLYHSLEEKVAAKSRELVRSERLASVGFLAAGVAHEINNPLHVISGYAELSLKRLRQARPEADPKQPESALLSDAEQTLQIIRDEAFRCKQITEKLLSLSKPGTGRHEPVSLAGVAHDVVAMVRAHKAYRDRQIVLRLDPEEPLMTRGSDSELKQVLLNLVINGLEAVEPSSGQVHIDGTRQNGCIELRVTDNGCGMSPEICDRIFEPFFTSKPGGQRGLGLGLSISHAIVEAHGGAIGAESDGPGTGSRFTLRLPSLNAATLPQGVTA